MKFSITNISWGTLRIEDLGSELKNIGIQGIEIAPTLIWKDLAGASTENVLKYKKICEDLGLKISGIQSLMYGHLEFQIFNQGSWASMINHLEKVINIGGNLNAEIAVFGSPKNRIKGAISNEQAFEIATIFFKKLIPYLQESNLVLTLEPNAPGYGADFLTHYEEVVSICDVIDSEWIKPQIDTGCAVMVGEDPVKLFEQRAPRHIHLSAPNHEFFSSSREYLPFISFLKEQKFEKWVVFEMLAKSRNSSSSFIESARFINEMINFGIINE